MVDDYRSHIRPASPAGPLSLNMVHFVPGAGSAVSSDSGVWTGGECAGEGSPRMRRRPRNLEMVMRGTHSFHLRELQVADLDIMGETLSVF